MAKDVLGRFLKVGQIVAYPGRVGSSMWMNYGDVQETGDGYIKVLNRTPDPWNGQPLNKLVKVTALDRVVIAKEAA